MKKIFYIITIILFILLTFIIILINFLSNKGVEIEVLPTPTPINTSSDYNYPSRSKKSISPTISSERISTRSSQLIPSIDINNPEKKNSTALQEILKNLPVLKSADINELETLKKNLPYETSDFAVDYSPLFNNFIISKKTALADEKIQKWSADNDLTDLINDPKVFVMTNQPIADIRKPAEDVLQNYNDQTINSQPTEFPPNPLTTSASSSSSFNESMKSLEKILRTVFNEETLKDYQLAPTSTIPGKQSSGTIPTSTGTVPSTLSEIFNEVSTKVGVPAKILEGVMRIEYPSTFNLSSNEISSYSTPGNTIPSCGPNLCSAAGPMQMTIGIDNQGNTSCPSCGAGYCPNAWSSYGSAINRYGGYSHAPNPCNIKDNVYAAALKLRSDAQASSPTDWTQAQVYKAAQSYYGSCNDSHRYVRLGNRTYCEYLWWYYTNSSVSSSSINGSSSFVYYCQGNTSWQNTCSLGQGGCGPTSLAMILSSFGTILTPVQVDQVFRQNGWRTCSDAGSVMTSAISSSWLTSLGFTVGQNLVNGSSLNMNQAKKYIDNGFLLIGSSKQYPCVNCRSASRIDHIFVIDNLDPNSGSISIRDPNNCSYAGGNDEIQNNRIKNVNDFPWYYAYPIKKT